MGTWGITAFDSDTSLDALQFIRKNHLQNGRLKLEKAIEAMQQTEYYAPDPKEGQSHSGILVLAELILKYLEDDMERVDLDDDDKKFGDMISFTASRSTIEWMREYMAVTLREARANAEYYGDWNEWFEEKNWIEWQAYIETKIDQFDDLLHTIEDNVDFAVMKQQRQAQEQRQKQKLDQWTMQL